MRKEVKELAAQKAVSKAFKTSRDRVAPGTYENVKVLVEIEVDSLRVGEDYQARLVQRAKPWNLVAAAQVFIEKTNEIIRRAQISASEGDTDGVLALLSRAGITMEDVIKASDTIDPTLMTAAKEAANRTIAAAKEPTLSTCRGKVTIKGINASIVTPETGTVSL